MLNTNQTRVLLVDDDPEIAWGVGRCLTRAGCVVTTCGDGVEAIELLEERAFDVLITDIQMPRLNGLALVEWVAHHCPGTRVVVMTAFGSPSIQQVVLKKGAVLYLEKPFDPSLLSDLIFSEPDPDSFSGSVDGVDIFDYIQLIFHTMRQALVRIHSSDGREGRLFIKEGTAWHAECGDDEGESAFYACLGFRGGNFSTMPWEEPPRRTIHTRGDFLLLDAARTKDESALGADETPAPTMPDERQTARSSEFDFTFGEESVRTTDAERSAK